MVLKTDHHEIRKRVFFLGTTASGKTEWAVEGAESVGGVIINCDSVQVYRGLEIGSASPSREIQLRVPHFLFNYVPFPQELSLGDYFRDYQKEVREIPPQKPIFIVGGTGFYLRALERGLLEIPPVSVSMVKELEKAVEDPGLNEVLYRELIKVDPQSSLHIHKNDKYRLVRALAVYRSHGQTPRQFEEAQLSSKSSSEQLLKVGIQYSKDELLHRVKFRVESMLQSGLLDEVRFFCTQMEEQGVDWKKDGRVWKPLQSIGYREALDHFKGTLDREQLKDEIVLQTMKLIKKQRTWFKRDPDIQWLGPTELKKWIVQVKHFFLEDGV